MKLKGVPLDEEVEGTNVDTWGVEEVLKGTDVVLTGVDVVLRGTDVVVRGTDVVLAVLV